MKTALDLIQDALISACSYNPASETPPESVLWCDPNNEFEEIISLLRPRVPQLMTFGLYDISKRQGPALWLRAAAAGEIEEMDLPNGKTPIIYVPGIGREILRGAEDCPVELQPLVWLAISGCFFGHINGKDWTLRAIFAAERGPVQLSIGEDLGTRAALKLAASRLVTRPLPQVCQKHWDAAALYQLIAPDLTADTLDWLNGTLEAADEQRFSAFNAQALRELGFSPKKLSREQGGDLLLGRADVWAEIWERFKSNPQQFTGIRTLLATKEPADLITQTSFETYPRVNAREEDTLRAALSRLRDVSAPEAAAEVLALEKAHGPRRETAWAKLGESRLAESLYHLAHVAAAKPVPSSSAQVIAAYYFETGWTTDWAALKAWSSVTSEVDQQAVAVALRAIYLPWLDVGARTLQELARNGGVPFAKPQKNSADFDILLFVDGLRMDLARSLVERLANASITAELEWTWSGFPTTTATCKTLLSPVAETIVGQELSSDFLPRMPDGKPASKANLDKALTAAGWTLQPDLLGSSKLLWVETGRFDEEGHALGEGLAERVDAELDRVADRIAKLAASGRRIRVVTDHGWLLIPGGLEKAHLDSGLAEPNGKRSRCAIVKDQSKTALTKVPWSWNETLFVAPAPGATSFFAAQPYAHGGVSPQECVLPVITIEAREAEAKVSIETTEWTNLRLRVATAGAQGCTAEIVNAARDQLLAGPKSVNDDGTVALLVSDDYDREFAMLVIRAPSGGILAEKKLVVGQS